LSLERENTPKPLSAQLEIANKDQSDAPGTRMAPLSPQAVFPDAPIDQIAEFGAVLSSRNTSFASQNRRDFTDARAFAMNLMSAPGAGKTTLLCQTAERLKGIDMTVIEADPQTSEDAERLRATGVPAVQINTGAIARLDGYLVHRAVSELPLTDRALVFIENLGNLIAPAHVDLGQDMNIAMLSVAEGEDKPLKYPEIFAHAQLVILSKTDLAPHCDVDLDLMEYNLRKVSPQCAVIRLSARTGEGMAEWMAWLRGKRALKGLGARAA